MLSYVKLILSKVSFDAKLFEKELRKAIVKLVPIEVADLKLWCYENYSHLYGMILDRTFITA